MSETAAMGRLIVLTGSTGAGKTTTCKEFVAQQERLWLHFGIDTFLGTCVPRKFVDGGPCADQGVHMEPDDPADPDGDWHMDMGRYGMGLVRSFHQMLATAVRSGQDVICDHIAGIDPPILQDMVQALDGLPVFLVALKPPPEVSPRRIDERLDTIIRSIGREHAIRNSENKKKVARALYDGIFSHDCFDLTIDTERHTPAQVVEIIRNAMGDCRGGAVPELRQRLQNGDDPFGNATG